GPACTIANSTLSIATAINMSAGVYKFELTVTDNSGAIDKDTMQVTVNPDVSLARKANAVSDITITLPVNTTNLNGSASSDPDGSISSYSWMKISCRAA